MSLKKKICSWVTGILLAGTFLFPSAPVLAAGNTSLSYAFSTLIVGGVLPNAVEGTAYSASITTANSNNPNNRYSMLQGPGGMTINAAGVLHWQPPYDAERLSIIIVKIKNNWFSYPAVFVLFVENVEITNRAPVFTSVPVTSATENSAYSYTLAATDADGQALSYALTTSPQGMSLSGNILSWTPGNTQSGSHAVTVTVSDGKATVAQSFTIAVANANFAPEFTSTPNTSGIEGAAYSYALTASDADGQILTYALNNAPQGMALTGNILNWTPAYNQAGNHSVTVTVTDGEATAEQTFSINVANTNRTPEFTSSAVTTATEGTQYSYALAATDADGQTLTYALTIAPQGMVLTGTALSWIPTYTQAGNHSVTVTATDGEATAIQTFTISVANTNRAPVFTSTPDTTAIEGTAYSTVLAATDADNQTLSYALTAAPQGMVLSGHTLSWTPAYDQAGNQSVTVTVTDGESTDTQSFTIAVTNTNRAPEFSSTANTNATESEAYSYSLSASDADNQSLSFALTAAPQGMTLTGNTLNWTPTYDQAGNHTVTVTVTDGEATVTQTFTVAVANTNQAPVITSTAALTATENTAYSYTLEASDADGQTLNYALTTSPQGMTRSGNTLSWTPTYTQAGSHAVTVTVSDGETTVEQSFTIEVANTNRAPEFTSTAITTATENSAYTYTLAATDADEQALTFALTTAPQGMTLTGNALSWTPSYDQAGTHNVTITVTDGEATVEQTFTITVANTNQLPAFTSTPDTSAQEGSAYSYTFTATDADGQALTYALGTVPEGMALNTNTLSWTPSYTQAGNHTVTITATDGEATVEQTFSLAVANTNRAPEFTSTPVTTAIEGLSYNYALTASDADGQAISLALSDAPQGMALVDNVLGWMPTYEQAGTYTITVTATDGEATTAHTFTIVVANNNRAPEFTSIPVTTGQENSAYSYTVEAIDADGQLPVYSLMAGPEGMSLNFNTLSWLPGFTQAGDYTVTVLADDGVGITLHTFTLSIANTNRSPVISSTSSVTQVQEHDTYSYSVIATDADDDTLSYSINNAPAGMSLSSNIISWQPNKGQAGVYSFSVIVSDSKVDVTQTINLTVVIVDTDSDGLRDEDDQCLATPAGETINADGCALVQLDTDNDTVNDKLDQCADSNRFETIGADGCSDTARDTDKDGIPDMEDPSPNDATNQALPNVTIESPVNLATLGASPVTVTGTVDPAAASLTVNGAAVTFDASGHYTAQVAIAEGHNTIISRMVSTSGIVSTASISVSLDKTAPYITIDSHSDGQTVTAQPITVTGLINDIVRGTVESQQATVSVNGVNATIANRSYAAFNIPLQAGENTLTVMSYDQAGNIASKDITVFYQAPLTLQQLHIVSGQQQTAVIGTALANPLSVQVLDEAGHPMANKMVVFRVTQGDGAVGLGTSKEGNGTIVHTNAQGIASTTFKTGLRSGVANNKIAVRVVGYEEVTFTASATPGTPDKVSVNSGNNQYGEKYQPLPAPFVVSVTDNGANVVAGAQVEFTVLAGGGHFQNNEKTLIATTDTDGRASAHLTNGGLGGFDAQVVQARLLNTELGTPAEQTITAGFTATAMQAGDPGNTSVSGIVTDTEDTPLIGATVRIDGTTRQAVTDDKGKFIITAAPVGPVHLIVDGSTVEGDAEYPTLSYNIVTVSGVDNPLTAPVYMVKLNTANKQYAGLQDVAVTLPEVPGFKLEIPAGSVTFPDGSKEGYISVTVVNSSKVPMLPPNGMQPQFIVTIQPTGAMFEPPARLTLPNVDGHAPGRQVEMFSYDHDLEEFVAIGLGTVSKDGKTIQSNPGVGVVKAGWHCGAQPGGDGCCEKGKCDDYCAVFNGVCAAGCKIDNPKVLKDEDQKKGNCKKETCGGGKYDVPKDDLTEEDKKCNLCENGEKNAKADGTMGSEVCKTCIGGVEKEFLSEIQGPEFICTDSQYQIMNSHPNNAQPIWGGDADSEGMVDPSDGLVDGDSLTVTAEVEGCIKSKMVTFSDGFPGSMGEHLACGLYFYDCQAITDAIDAADAWAYNNEIALGGNARQGGCADAAHHAYWNALGAANGSVEAMQAIADGHEYDSATANCEDNNMDLHNNRVGRDIGVQCGKGNEVCMQNAIVSALKNGSLTAWTSNLIGGGPLIPTGIDCEITY